MDIDFVVLWVDGKDPKWLEEKAKYQAEKTDDSNSVNRFRDWGLMPYWFRAVEKFAPWVRKVHFVTFGHVPEWLNMDCPKLIHVQHSDFIPPEYLPTFNANTIEMNIYRISDLAEHFVFFNDDMFLLRPMKEQAFFQNDLPCTNGSEVPLQISGSPGIWQHLIVNDMRVINNHFDKRTQFTQNRKKYVSNEYRWQDNVRTRLLNKLYPDYYLGFKNLHAPAAFLKSTFEEIWEKEHNLLNDTCLRRFRTNDDVNQWLALWWQAASGRFYPYMTDNIVEDVCDQTIEGICESITGQTNDMICINDPSDPIDFKSLNGKLIDAFEKILPVKSSFER